MSDIAQPEDILPVILRNLGVHRGDLGKSDETHVKLARNMAVYALLTSRDYEREEGLAEVGGLLGLTRHQTLGALIDVKALISKPLDWSRDKFRSSLEELARELGSEGISPDSLRYTNLGSEARLLRDETDKILAEVMIITGIDTYDELRNSRRPEAVMGRLLAVYAFRRLCQGDLTAIAEPLGMKEDEVYGSSAQVLTLVARTPNPPQLSAESLREGMKDTYEMIKSDRERKEAEIAAQRVKKIQISEIIEIVSEESGTRVSEIIGRSRHRSVSIPRQAGMYEARRLGDYSLVEIGLQFGGRDHTTVIYACDKFIEAPDFSTDPRTFAQEALRYLTWRDSQGIVKAQASKTSKRRSRKPQTFEKRDTNDSTPRISKVKKDDDPEYQDEVKKRIAELRRGKF